MLRKTERRDICKRYSKIQQDGEVERSKERYCKFSDGCCLKSKLIWYYFNFPRFMEKYFIMLTGHKAVITAL